MQVEVLPLKIRHQFIFSVDVRGVVTMCVRRWKPKLFFREMMIVEDRRKGVQIPVCKNDVMLIIDE